MIKISPKVPLMLKTLFMVDDVASSTKQDELKNWLPYMMKWLFQSNDEANKKVTYTNTCPLDSTLQLLWMLWKRGAL